MSGDPIQFHAERAQAELELAMRAGHSAAARAHLTLSEVHLERVNRLTGGWRAPTRRTG